MKVNEEQNPIGESHVSPRPAQPTIPCGVCGDPTPMLVTERCDRCYELCARIGADPALAQRILTDIRKGNEMPKQRPSVDTHVYDAADELLNLSEKFPFLRSDIREDLTWELAAQIQRVWEDFCREQKLD